MKLYHRCDGQVYSVEDSRKHPHGGLHGLAICLKGWREATPYEARMWDYTLPPLQQTGPTNPPPVFRTESGKLDYTLPPKMDAALHDRVSQLETTVSDLAQKLEILTVENKRREFVREAIRREKLGKFNAWQASRGQ